MLRSTVASHLRQQRRQTHEAFSRVMARRRRTYRLSRSSKDRTSRYADARRVMLTVMVRGGTRGTRLDDDEYVLRYCKELVSVVSLPWVCFLSSSGLRL